MDDSWTDLYQDRGRPLGLSGGEDSVDDSWTDLYQDRGRPLGLSGGMDNVDDSWTDVYQDRGIGHLVYLVAWIVWVIAGLTCSRIGGIKPDLSGGVDSLHDR